MRGKKSIIIQISSGVILIALAVTFGILVDVEPFIQQHNLK
jgi:hypothetical protein